PSSTPTIFSPPLPSPIISSFLPPLRPSFLVLFLLLLPLSSFPLQRRLEGRQKPYKCPHCLKSYSSKSNLNTHVRDLHAAVPHIFTCPYCTKKYSSKNSLRYHITMYHREEKDRDQALQHAIATAQPMPPQPSAATTTAAVAAVVASSRVARANPPLPPPTTSSSSSSLDHQSLSHLPQLHHHHHHQQQQQQLQQQQYPQQQQVYNQEAQLDLSLLSENKYQLQQMSGLMVEAGKSNVQQQQQQQTPTSTPTTSTHH
ncbi:hypothetical protein Pcinc_020406, partial [Petrolisthes cinctipes]